MEESNAAQVLRDALGPVIALDEEYAEQERDLMQKLDRVRAERTRLKRVVALIENEPKKNGPKLGTRPTTKPGGSNNWTVSEAKVALVQAALSNFDSEFRIPEVEAVMKEAGTATSHETIRRALDKLREAGMVRLVRRDPGNGSAVFLVTPKGREMAGKVSSANGAS